MVKSALLFPSTHFTAIFMKVYIYMYIYKRNKKKEKKSSAWGQFLKSLGTTKAEKLFLFSYR